MSGQSSFPSISDKPQYTVKRRAAIDYPQPHVVISLVAVWLGVAFLLQQLSLIASDFNWWAIFFIAAGGWVLLRAFAARIQAGTWAGYTRLQAILSVLLLLIGNVFMFNLAWGAIWPLFLIVSGILALGFIRSSRE